MFAEEKLHFKFTQASFCITPKGRDAASNNYTPGVSGFLELESGNYSDGVVCSGCKAKLGLCSSFFFFMKTEFDVQVGTLLEVIVFPILPECIPAMACQRCRSPNNDHGFDSQIQSLICLSGLPSSLL